MPEEEERGTPKNIKDARRGGRRHTKNIKMPYRLYYTLYHYVCLFKCFCDDAPKFLSHDQQEARLDRDDDTTSQWTRYKVRHLFIP